MVLLYGVSQTRWSPCMACLTYFPWTQIGQPGSSGLPWLDRNTQTAIFTTEPPILVFSGAIQDAQGDLEKQSIFKPVSKTDKIRKPAPRASKKHKKTTFELPKNGFCENMVFAIPSTRKPCSSLSITLPGCLAYFRVYWDY